MICSPRWHYPAAMSEARKRARDADRDQIVDAIESAFVDGQLTDAEREERVTQALRAKTLGELRSLVRDLQTDQALSESPGAESPHPGPADPGPPEPGPHPARRPRAPQTRPTWLGRRSLLIAGGAGVGLVAVSAGVWLWRGFSRPDFTTPKGFATFLAEYRAKFETLDTLKVVLYPDYAVVDVPLRGSAPRHESWTFRDDSWSEFADPSVNSASVALVHLDEVNAEAWPALIRRAKHTLNVEDPNSLYLVIDYWTVFDDAPRVSIVVSNTYGETGILETSLAGDVVTSQPYSPPGQTPSRAPTS